MDIWEENLKQHLQKLPKLSSPSLEAKLLSRMAQEKTAQTRHKRTQKWTAAAASLCCLVILGISVPYWWQHRTQQPGATAGGSTASGANSITSRPQSAKASQNVDWPASNLTVASTQVLQVGQNPKQPVSAANPMTTVHVQAILKNSSQSQALSNQNVQGVLFFFKDGQQIASYFVDGPKDPVPPGKSVNWSYDPSPASWPKSLQNVPVDRLQTKLAFVTRTSWSPQAVPANAGPAGSTLTAEIPGVGWRIGQSPLLVTNGEFTGTGANHMYMSLTVDIYNPTNLVISQNNLMGFVFLPKLPGDQLLNDFTYKYMVDIPLNGSSIQPHAHQTATLLFMGNQEIDLTNRTPVVTIVSKAVPSE